MFHLGAKVEDIETWRKAEAIDKVLRALSSRDPRVRLAAASALGKMRPKGPQINKIIAALSDPVPPVRAAVATALRQVDSNEDYTSSATLNSVVAALIRHLDDAPQVVASVAPALRWFVVYHRPGVFAFQIRPEAVEALIMAMNRTEDKVAREAVRQSIGDLLLWIGGGGPEVLVAISSVLSQKQGLARQTVDDLLEMFAEYYININFGTIEPLNPEESLSGRILTKFGPAAGRQLIKVGERRHESHAVAFGRKLVRR